MTKRKLFHFEQYSRKRSKKEIARSISAKMSGAALGYIVGNVPGAVSGYKLGGTLAKKMYLNTPPPSHKKFKLSKRIEAPNHAPPPITKAGSRHKGKPTSFSKKKKVKVSKGLRSKINSVLSGKKIDGSWRQISFDSIKCSNFVTNAQIVDGLAQIVGLDWSNWAFDPEDVLHAASVLWHGKADSQNARSWDGQGNIQTTVAVTAGIEEVAPNNTVGALYNRFMNGLKITVKKSHEIYKLKNNTQRTVVMKIYLCAPLVSGTKSSSTKNAPNTTSGANSTITTEAAIGDPVSVWSNAMIQQGGQNINLASANPQTLYQNPQANPIFNKVYKTDCTTVVLQPGQIYDYYIQGPQDFTYSYSSFFRGDAAEAPIYLGVQKFMRYPLFTAYMDVITDGDRSGHYPPSVAVGAGQAISIEREMKYQLEMPEQVGLKLGVAAFGAGQVSLNMRVSPYYHIVYTPTGPTNNLNRVDVQDPTVVMDQT